MDNPFSGETHINPLIDGRDDKHCPLCTDGVTPHISTSSSLLSTSKLDVDASSFSKFALLPSDNTESKSSLSLSKSTSKVPQNSADDLTGSSSLVGVDDNDILAKATPITAKTITVRGKGNLIIGTNKAEVIDLRPSKGNNTVFGKKGDDTVYASKKDEIHGDAGKDELIADKKSKGKNELYGGKGNDTLYGKVKDVLLGEKGNDILNVFKYGKGKNTVEGGPGNDILIAGFRDRLTGDKGKDVFRIMKKPPKRANIITDFELGKDTIDFEKVRGIDELSDLTLSQAGQNTAIQFNGKTIVTVRNIQANVLNNIANFSGIEVGTPQLLITDTTAFEGDTGTSTLQFSLALNTVSSESVSVDYAIAPGTATAGIDYTVGATSGTLTFAPGTQTQVINVNVRGDILDENDETIIATLTNAVNASLSDGQAIGTILDDEAVLTNREGKEFSASAQNQQDILAQFEAYTIDRNGIVIDDQKPYDDNIGDFLGAIENFRTAQGELLVDDDGNVIVDSEGRALINPDIPLIFSDTLIDIGNLEAKFVESNPLFGDRDVIEYTFYSSNGSTRENVKTVVLDFQDETDFNDFPDVFLPNDFDVKQAINSLTYILDNNLLGATEFLAEDRLTSGAPDIIFNTTIQDPLGTPSSSYISAASTTVSSFSKNSTGSKNQFNVSALSNPNGNSNQAIKVQGINGERIKITGSNQTVKGTSKDDLLDASRGKGRNTLRGGKGNDILKGKKKDKLFGEKGDDRLFVGKRDSAFGGNGNDVLDASKGNGNNTLRGDAGRDTLIGRNKDTLIGGKDADTFVIAQKKLPKNPLRVKDFKRGTDQLLLQKIRGVNSFNDLTLKQKGRNTLIQVQGKVIAQLNKIKANQLSSSDFKGLDSPSAPLSIANVSIFEGNTGSSNLIFTVKLNQSIVQPVTLNYATSNDTAIAGTDYVATNGTLTFTPNNLVKTLSVGILGDVNDENDEQFSVNVSGVLNGANVQSRAIGTILDDEDEQVGSRRGKQYSATSGDEQSLLAQFYLVDRTDTGTPITDIDSNTQVGIFPNAIEDFATGSGFLLSVGDTSQVPFTPNRSLVNANLVARYITDAESEPIVNFSDEPAFAGRDTIEYAIQIPGESEFAQRYRLDFGAPGFSIPNFDVNQAINSLTYILEKDLLNISRGLLPSGDSIFAVGGILPTRTIKTYSQERQDPGGNVSLVSQFSLVDTQFNQGLDAFTPISDSTGGSNAGTFVGAVESYTNNDTSASFSLGTLTASISSNQITYTLMSQVNSVTDSAVLDLAGLEFDQTLAVNDLAYILENDLVQLAFFS